MALKYTFYTALPRLENTKNEVLCGVPPTLLLGSWKGVLTSYVD